jgi:hypothetical protein
MPQLAFYRVVSDVKVLDFPSDGDNQELTFDATGDIVLDDLSARPLVCFQMDPDSRPDEPAKSHLEVFIRDMSGADRKICTHDFRGGTKLWTMEPFRPEWMRKGENKLIFKAKVDVGSLKISNVVVFFQRHI